MDRPVTVLDLSWWRLNFLIHECFAGSSQISSVKIHRTVNPIMKSSNVWHRDVRKQMLMIDSLRGGQKRAKCGPKSCKPALQNLAGIIDNVLYLPP